MLKLHKKVGDILYFWEVCEKDAKTGVIHWGIVGECGEKKEVKSTIFSNFLKSIQKEIDQKIKEGFAELEEADYSFLEIEYLIDGFGTEADLDKRHRLENKMDEILGQTSLGQTNGGSIGSGTMEVGCVVVDFHIAKRVIEETLKNTEFANFSRIFELGEN